MALEIFLLDFASFIPSGICLLKTKQKKTFCFAEQQNLRSILKQFFCFAFKQTDTTRKTDIFCKCYVSKNEKRWCYYKKYYSYIYQHMNEEDYLNIPVK